MVEWGSCEPFCGWSNHKEGGCVGGVRKVWADREGVKGSVILIRPVLVGLCLQAAFCCSLQAQQKSKAHTDTPRTHIVHRHTHTHDDSKTTVSHVYLRLCSLKNRLQLAGAKPKTVQTSARGVGCVSQWNWRSGARSGEREDWGQREGGFVAWHIRAQFRVWRNI